MYQLTFSFSEEELEALQTLAKVHGLTIYALIKRLISLEVDCHIAKGDAAHGN